MYRLQVVKTIQDMGIETPKNDVVELPTIIGLSQNEGYPRASVL